MLCLRQRGDSKKADADAAANPYMLRKESDQNSTKREWIRRVSGTCGMLGPTVGMLSVYDSVKDYAHFSWKHQAISDIFSTRAGHILTTGMVAAGLLTTTMAYGLHENHPKNGIAKAGTALLGIGGVSLATMAISQGSLSYLHYPMALGYFTSTSAALMALGTDFLRRQRSKVIGTSTFIAGFGSLGVLATTLYSGLAFQEVIASSMLGTWVFCAGAALALGKEKGMLASETKFTETNR